MTLHHLIFNPYEVNTYIIAAADGQCAIVDPGCTSPDEQEKLKQFIAEKGLRPVWLVNTHGHYDHVVGNAFVCNNWQVKNALHHQDLMFLDKGFPSIVFGFPAEKPPVPTVFLKDGDTVEIGDDVSLQVIHVPGHSPGSILLYSPEQKWIITGDVLFRGSIGRTDLPGGDFESLINGIKKKLISLPSDTKVLPGHGAFTSIEREKAHNPFMK